MEYSFKPNLFQKRRTLRIDADTLDIVNEAGKVTRSLDMRDVRSFCEFPSGRVIDPELGSCPMSQCTVSFRTGGSVTFKSASYSGPDAGTDHTPAYRKFIGHLMERAAEVNPDTAVINGSMAIVVIWILLGLVSALFLIFGFILGLSPLFTNDSFGEVLPLAGPCVLTGGVMTRISFLMLRNYWPSRTTVRRVVSGDAEERDTSNTT